MGVSDAIIEAVAELGWSATMLAAVGRVSEAAAKKWLDKNAVPGGETLLILMRDVPGLRERLGFQLVTAA